MFKWEAISTKIDIKEGLSGTFDKIRQTLADLENRIDDMKDYYRDLCLEDRLD